MRAYSMDLRERALLDRSSRSPELAQEVERHLALHARPQLPPGHVGLGAHLARRRHPRLDALDHVPSRRPQLILFQSPGS